MCQHLVFEMEEYIGHELPSSKLINHWSNWIWLLIRVNLIINLKSDTVPTATHILQFWSNGCCLLSNQLSKNQLSEIHLAPTILDKRFYTVYNVWINTNSGIAITQHLDNLTMPVIQYLLTWLIDRISTSMKKKLPTWHILAESHLSLTKFELLYHNLCSFIDQYFLIKIIICFDNLLWLFFIR